MRDDGALERGIEDVERLVVARPRLVMTEPDLCHLVGNARRGSDLEPAAGKVVEHADLFDQLPGCMIGRYHAERPQAQLSGSRRDVGDQEVGRRRIGRAEVMLAEKNAFEARRLGAGPQVEVGIEVALRYLRIELLVELARSRKELKDPRLDHACRPLLAPGKTSNMTAGR